MLARVFIVPKSGVLDPQGNTVATSLHALGFDSVRSVRVGKCIEVEIAEEDPERASEQVRSMCERLLANAVIEDFHFELGATAPGAASDAGRGSR